MFQDLNSGCLPTEAMDAVQGKEGRKISVHGLIALYLRIEVKVIQTVQTPVKRSNCDPTLILPGFEPILPASVS